MNSIASNLGDLICVGVGALDIRALNASCTARSSTITIGYLAMVAMAIGAIIVLRKSRRSA